MEATGGTLSPCIL